MLTPPDPSGRDTRHWNGQSRARPPILRLHEATEDAAERHATWTELFFDLVFGVAVAQLAARLHDHLSLTGVGAFAALFVPWCRGRPSLMIRTAWVSAGAAAR